MDKRTRQAIEHLSVGGSLISRPDSYTKKPRLHLHDRKRQRVAGVGHTTLARLLHDGPLTFKRVSSWQGVEEWKPTGGFPVEFEH